MSEGRQGQRLYIPAQGYSRDHGFSFFFKCLLVTPSPTEYCVSVCGYIVIDVWYNRNFKLGLGFNFWMWNHSLPPYYCTEVLEDWVCFVGLPSWSCDVFISQCTFLIDMTPAVLRSSLTSFPSDLVIRQTSESPGCRELLKALQKQFPKVTIYYSNTQIMQHLVYDLKYLKWRDLQIAKLFCLHVNQSNVSIV